MRDASKSKTTSRFEGCDAMVAILKNKHEVITSFEKIGTSMRKHIWRQVDHWWKGKQNNNTTTYGVCSGTWRSNINSRGRDAIEIWSAYRFPLSYMIDVTNPKPKVQSGPINSKPLWLLLIFQQCAQKFAWKFTQLLNNQLENVAIANALQLEAARCRAVPIRFNFVDRANLNSLSLSLAVLERFYCLYVRLRCDLELWPRDLDLWPLTLNICCRPFSSQSNAVRNLSEIGQSAAELLQFEYLTLWPWTRMG